MKVEEETKVEVAEEQVATETTGSATEQAQTEATTQAVETKAQAPSLADVEARFETRIREEREASRRENEAMLERVKQSNRDTTRARFDEISARLDALKFERQSEVGELLKSQQIDPTAAALRYGEIDREFQRRKIEEQKAVSQTAPQQTAQAPTVQAANDAWESYKRDALDLADLTGQEPEFVQAIAAWKNVSDLDGAKAQFKRVVKAARQQVDARVKPKAETKTTKTAPVMEVGGTGGAVTGNEYKPKATLDDADDLAEAFLEKIKKERGNRS